MRSIATVGSSYPGPTGWYYPNSMTCPDSEQFRHFRAGVAPAIDAHLRECDACADLITGQLSKPTATEEELRVLERLAPFDVSIRPSPRW